jgi:hypothetical protein
MAARMGAGTRESGPSWMSGSSQDRAIVTVVGIRFREPRVESSSRGRLEARAGNAAKKFEWRGHVGASSSDHLQWSVGSFYWETGWSG